MDIVGSFKNFILGDCSKMFRCKARKNRTARRIFIYIEWCGLKRNTADKRFSTAHFVAYLRRQLYVAFNKNSTASGNLPVFRVVKNRLRQILSSYRINNFSDGFYNALINRPKKIDIKTYG